jgi:hypothetical protein
VSGTKVVKSVRDKLGCNVFASMPLIVMNPRVDIPRRQPGSGPLTQDSTGIATTLDWNLTEATNPRGTAAQDDSPLRLPKAPLSWFDAAVMMLSLVAYQKPADSRACGETAHCRPRRCK